MALANRHHGDGVWVGKGMKKYTDVEPEVELDVHFTQQGFPLVEGMPDELNNVVTAVEMKTTRSSNDPNNRSLINGGTMTKVAMEIRDQVSTGGATWLLKWLHPDKPFVIHGFSVAPAHLAPITSNGSEYIAIGSDVLDITDRFPVVAENKRNWLEYIDKLAAFTLAVVYSYDTDIADAVNSRFPDQKGQIDAYEAWFSLGLKLPPASSIHESIENIVFVYSRWGITIVVKVFGNPTTYANELLCYRRLEKLQGAGIPVLYATGSVGTRPCLVLSYEGQKLREDPTEEERAALQPVIDHMHQLKVHHHDLHPQNVVRNGDGKLTLIDFGFSGPCTRGGDCSDEWELDNYY
ncbi:protein kinase subdomain-containing protein PKL/ccin4 [Coprinopsis cinerea AmutBmut pab1-1]|nr:protein kinase subdomain-containing protein PKL/ccin4 [Coprinopsis cinerea AmutBmut pab1-1]